MDQRSFDPLSEAEVGYVREQLTRAHEFALAFDPRADADFPTLESFDRAFENFLESGEPSEANGVVQAVGVAFGARLVERLGFEWVIATDPYGTGLAVLALPGLANVTIFPVEFVVKRYERREVPFLVAALDEIGGHLREITAECSESA